MTGTAEAAVATSPMRTALFDCHARHGAKKASAGQKEMLMSIAGTAKETAAKKPASRSHRKSA